MKTPVIDVALTVLVVLLSCNTVRAVENTKINPHTDDGDCAICHIAPVSKLRGWFVFESTKKEMKLDLDKLCLKCHTVDPTPEGSLGIGIGHATGKKLENNLKNLPLASDGTITCATTCHNMHPGPNNNKLLRSSINELCVSCHNR